MLFAADQDGGCGEDSDGGNEDREHCSFAQVMSEEFGLGIECGFEAVYGFVRDRAVELFIDALHQVQVEQGCTVGTREEGD